MPDYYAFGSGGLQETVRQVFAKIKTVFARNARETVLFPNFDGMTPLATYTYDIAASAYYRICSRANTGLTDISEYDDVLMFRIMVTGTNINQVADVFVQGSKAIAQPIALAFNRTLSASAATTGIRYLRFNSPKAINSGYGWDIEFYAYNATARAVKIEVFATTDNVTWSSVLTPTEYNSDNQSTASMTLYTSRGFCYLGTAPIAVSSASTSTYITGYLPLFIGGTQPVAGEALTANSLILFSGNKAYKASNKTVAITPEVGLAFLSNATSSGSALTYNYVRQKGSWTTLTGDSAMSKATIARGNPVYLRCTLSNGNIYSDAYLSPTMAAGYTWCYVGVAQSASAINVETTHPLFLTLDSNGKLTHINGKALNGGVTSVNGQTGAVTLSIPNKTSDLTNDSDFVNASGAASAAPVQSVNGQTGAVTITASEIGAYEKPTGGIPASDLASGVIPPVPSASSDNPQGDGTASPGSSTDYSRADHVHPHDSSKQDSLVSGTNIKTVNGNSLLGSGDVTISGGGGATKSSISLSATWSGSDPYTQTVTIIGYTVTANSKIDLQPDATAIAQMVSDGVTALYIENNNGTLTAYAVGAATTAALTVQCTITEVSV